MLPVKRAALAVLALLAGALAPARAQVIAEPCETCGVEFGKALPEGITFLDVEGYGQRDGQPNRLGVNIPTVAWSTPFSFYNTRLEVFAILPVTDSIDGATMNRFDYYASSIIVGGAHDLGNGFHIGAFAGLRSGDNFLNLGRQPAADVRASIVYEKYGFQAIATFVYSGNLGGKTVPLGSLGNILYNDNAFIDYTLLKQFGKFQIGVVGSAVEDITGPVPIKPGSISVGGLVGYDFGTFKLQGYVTREVAIRNGGWGLGPSYTYGGNNGGPETRGYFRVEVPLYKAPMAPSTVSARY